MAEFWIFHRKGCSGCEEISSDIIDIIVKYNSYTITLPHCRWYEVAGFSGRIRQWMDFIEKIFELDVIHFKDISYEYGDSYFLNNINNLYDQIFWGLSAGLLEAKNKNIPYPIYISSYTSYYNQQEILNFLGEKAKCLTCKKEKSQWDYEYRQIQDNGFFRYEPRICSEKCERTQKAIYLINQRRWKWIQRSRKKLKEVRKFLKEKTKSQEV